LKDSFNVLAAIMADEKESVVHRIRAATALPKTAKTLRLYIQDEEKYDALEKRLEEIEKQVGKRQAGHHVRK
jgi:hypothetical protein